MILKLKRTPGIYLVGFMASGKSTIGKLLAWELGWSFVDVDATIEARQGCSIAEIFDTRGEEEFRRIELEAIRAQVQAIERGKPTVVALGGGAFTQPEVCDLLEDNGVSIWLDCPIDLVRARLAAQRHRPLARDPEQLMLLYDQRRPIYARAQYRIDVTGDDPKAAVDSILKLPLF